jgi:hypothetical protein
VNGGRDAELDGTLECHGRHVVEAVVPKVGLRMQKLGVKKCVSGAGEEAAAYGHVATFCVRARRKRK